MTTARKAPGKKTEATNKTVATELRAPDHLARAGLDAEVDHDVRDYLGAFTEVESLKEKRFQEMIEHASSAG